MPKSPYRGGLPGHAETDTSIAAAEGVQKVATDLRSKGLEEIRAAGSSGLTSDELARQLNRPFWMMRPRTAELRKAGLIGDSGKRRINPETGKQSIVWVAREYLADAEREALPDAA